MFKQPSNYDIRALPPSIRFTGAFLGAFLLGLAVYAAFATAVGA